MIDEMIDEFGTLDLRGVVEIKNNEYEYEYEYEYNLQIKKIIIGNTIEKIGNYAFWSCSNIEEIKFEEGCKLKEISNNILYSQIINKILLIIICVNLYNYKYI